MSHSISGLRRLLSLVSIFSLFLVQPLPSLAAIPSSSLIRTAENAAVYYLAYNGKRYAFPNDKTFFTWFSFFSNINTVSSNELASYPLGGLVTYRPGIRLVKITTDPKVYAVAKGSVLRWIQNETVATQLYGANWAKQVDDLPDAFFTTYTVGNPIVNASDYSPTDEQNFTTTIDRNLLIPVPETTPTPSNPPAPPSSNPPPAVSTNYQISVTVSDATPSLGGTFSVLGSATPSGSISRIDLYLDNNLQRSCVYAPCGGDMITPSSGAKTAYEVRAEALWIDGHSATATTMITPKASSASGLSLSITKPEIKPGATQELIANVDSSFVAKYIDIYVDGGAVKGCTNTQSCRYSNPESSALGTTHSVYFIAQDANGIRRLSPTQTYTVVTNDHPLLQVTPGKTAIYKGEYVDVSVSASDDDGIQWTEIWANGNLIKRCTSSVCTTNTGPWNQAGSFTFVGRAQDGLGLQTSATSSDILVQ